MRAARAQLKILHVVPALTKGGGERVAVELANHSARSGHGVAVLAAHPVPATLLRDTLLPEVDVRYVRETQTSSTISRYLTLPPWLRRNRSWLAEFDVLHCHLTWGAVVGSLVHRWRSVARLRRPVIIETYHAIGMPVPPMHLQIHRRLLARRDAVAFMTASEPWTTFSARHPDVLWRIIPNGITPTATSGEPETRAELRRAIGIPDDARFVVGTVGMLRPDRQPWLHVPVFAEIARRAGPHVHFVIFGDGPELPRMRCMVEEYGLHGRLHLPGLASSVHEAASVMDLYIGLNIGPATGLAAAEAAMAGLPVLAVQLWSDYTPAPDDWIWSSTDPVQLAARAANLLDSAQDRRMLAERQQNHALRHHSSEAMARAYEDLYHAAIQRR